MITMIEKYDKDSYKTPWNCENDNDSNEGDNENSPEEIQTYRLSNPCTPIQDLENVPAKIDASFLNKDNKKQHIMNNLLYGNYDMTEENKETCNPEIQISNEKLFEENDRKSPIIKTCNFHLKRMLVPSKITTKSNIVSLRGRNIHGIFNESKLRNSVENIKSHTNEAPLFIKSMKENSCLNNTLTNEVKSNYSSENTSILNSQTIKNLQKALKKKLDNTSFRTPLQNSFRNSLLSSKNSIRILKKLTNKHTKKVMIVNNATK